MAGQVAIVSFANAVCGRAHTGSRNFLRFPELREAEVEQLRAAGRQHDVGGLQIAVNDSMTMGVVEGTGHLRGVRQRLGDRQWSSHEARRERLAFETLHDQKLGLLVATDIVKCADVRVRKGGYGHRFTREASAHSLIECASWWEDLDGDGAIEARVGGTEHLTHATSPEARVDAIRTKAIAGTDRTLTEQRRHRSPHGAVEDRYAIVVEQRLDFSA